MPNTNYLKLFVRTPVGTTQKLFPFNDASKASAHQALADAQAERKRLGDGELSIFKRTQHIRGVPEIGKTTGGLSVVRPPGLKHIGMPRT